MFSVSLSLSNRKCLVVGCSLQAHAIAIELNDQQAKVTVLSNSSDVPLPSDIEFFDRPFKETDLDECFVAVAASDSEADNERIMKACLSGGVFCYAPGDISNSTWRPQASIEYAHSATVEDITTGHITSTEDVSTGLVSLVGAGPGHPDLLTIRALQLIQSADAIVYDRLVGEPVMAMCNPKAKYVYAGKAMANHTLPQQSINALLVELAQEHKNVVRLKGGDPFIFGRGGEEIETLATQNIRFQIVPGITAASGCAAFSGIPLTHRDHAQSCIFVTGHLQDGKINLNWKELRDPTQTIVVYMGLTGLDAICKSLIEHGRAATTPAALVERGTKPEQRVLSSTLQNLPDVVSNSDVSAPTLLIIGSVVSLRDKLRWF